MIKYTYTNGVLINKFGIKDQEKLEYIENNLIIAKELTIEKLQIPLSFEGIKSIHKYLFSDIYSWAGKLRTTTLSKGHSFTHPNKITTKATKVFKDFESKNQLQGMKREEFAIEAAHLFGLLNEIHPFRDGNGRTQRIFLKEVAKQAGHELNFNPITQERMIQACIDYSLGNPKKMQEMFVEISNPKKIANLKKVNHFLIEGIGIEKWNNLYIANAHPNNTYIGIFVAQTKEDFLIQLRGNNNDIEENSLIIADNIFFQYLNNLNPQPKQNIILDIPI
ncbi:Fic/DOC family protein [Psychrobacter sp. I-STPA10]|uniref:Fic/DOC family protein n=1 Tax=Psychrobacter sp. I-STPA10 TaxID=2585769 RepID=UPI001E564AB2|nr:Fic family protein [Psychrobacter sp. I-STPA10]